VQHLKIFYKFEKFFHLADFGLARDIHSQDYYRKTTDGRLPVKWMRYLLIVEKFCAINISFAKFMNLFAARNRFSIKYTILRVMCKWLFIELIFYFESLLKILINSFIISTVGPMAFCCGRL
jgi:hypothetical protein